MELQELLTLLGRNIKYHRIKQKYTQKELTQIIGISAHTLSRIENGKVSILLYTIFKIQNALGITNGELFKF